MIKEKKLVKDITEQEFDNGYWYANEIKEFAKEIGIPHFSRLRKDELEVIIKIFLRTGKIKNPQRKNISKSGIRDIEKGLNRSLQITNYICNKQTQNFIINETQKIDPDLKIKSGVWYRLNRWREEQITNGKTITYGDLINQFIKLNQAEGSFKKIPVGRHINFISDFLANEKNSTREQAVAEWRKLKEMNIPKDYESWKVYRNRNI